jgi:hypothetical protein
MILRGFMKSSSKKGLVKSPKEILDQNALLKGYIYLTVVIIFLSMISSSNINAGLTPYETLNNAYYESNYNDPGKIIAGNLVDVVALKISNDPVNNLANSPVNHSEVLDLPTVFAVDAGLNRIIWNNYTPPTCFLCYVGSFSFNATKYNFSSIANIASDGKKYIYATDAGTNQIIRFSIYLDGKNSINLNYDKSIGGLGTNAGQFDGISGIKCDKNGILYVADSWNQRIQIFDSNLNYLNSITGPFGSSQIPLMGPTAVSVGPNGNIYIVDWSGSQIIELNSSYQYINSIARPERMKYIETDTNGNLYMTNGVDKNIYIFTSDLVYVSSYPMDIAPNGICEDKSNDGNGNITTRGKLGVVSGDTVEIFNLGVTIQNLVTNNINPSVWVNPTNNKYWPLNGQVQFKMTLPGGTYTVRDYLETGIFQNQLAAGSGGESTYTCNYIPLLANGTVFTAGNHDIAVNAVDSTIPSKDYRQMTIKIDDDTMGPTVNLTPDPATSNSKNGNLYASSQTTFTFTGGVDLDDTGATGCGIQKYQYSTDNMNWIDVSISDPTFKLAEAVGPNVTIYYRAVDNLNNVGQTQSLSNVIIGWQAAVNNPGSGAFAYKLSDTDMFMCWPSNQYGQPGMMHFDGANWSNITQSNNINIPGRFIMLNRYLGYGIINNGNTSTGASCISKWNGRVWNNAITNSTNAPLSDISQYTINNSPKTIVAAGASLYELQNNDTSLGLVWGSGIGNINRIKMENDGAATCWMVGTCSNGSNGFIENSTIADNGWNLVTSSAPQPLNDIWIFSDGTGWAVGNNGCLLQIQNGVTQVISIPTAINCDYLAIYMKDENTGWIAGTNGVILSYNGNQWKISEAPVNGGATLSFITASMDTAWVGGQIQVPYSSEMQGVLLRNYTTSFVPVTRPIGLQSESDGTNIKLSWQPGQSGSVDNITGYNLYEFSYYNISVTSIAGYNAPINVENVTSYNYPVSGAKGVKYAFAVTANYAGTNTGESYYSNENLTNSDGSMFISAGTDLYPCNFLVNGSTNIHATSNNLAYFAAYPFGTMLYNGQMWKNSGIALPSDKNFATTNSQYSIYGGVDYSASGDLLEVLSGNIGSGYETDVWEYYQGQWKEFNYNGKGMSPNNTNWGENESISQICGGVDNVWVAGNFTGSSTTGLLAKYMGTGNWMQYHENNNTSIGFFKMTSDSFGFGTDSNGSVIFSNGSFIEIPSPSLTLDDFIAAGTGENMFQCTTVLGSNVYFLDQNTGWAIVTLLNYSLDGKYSQQRSDAIEGWDGKSWKLEYVVPDTNGNMNGLSFTGSAANNNIEGWAFGNNGLLFHYNGTSWTKVNKPAELNINAMDFKTGITSWIASSGQMWTIDNSVKNSGTIGVPSNPTASAQQISSPIQIMQVTVSWTGVGSATPAVKGYNIYRAFNGGNYVLDASVTTNTANTYSFTDNRFMTASGTYHYKISAYNIDGLEGALSTDAAVSIGSQYLFTPTATLTPTWSITLTSTPTQAATPLNTSWEQYGNNSEHTYSSASTGYNPGNSQYVYPNVSYNFYAPDTVGNLVVDNNNTSYFSTQDSDQNYIFMIDSNGDVNYAYIIYGSINGMALGKNNHLYYSDIDQLGQCQLRAMNTVNGNIDWIINGPFGVGPIQVDGNYNIYEPTRGGIDKFEDVDLGGGSYGYNDLWPGKTIGNELCFEDNLDSNFVVDNGTDGNGNIGCVYISRPMIATCPPDNNISGMQIIKYLSDGTQSQTGTTSVTLDTDTDNEFDFKSASFLIDQKNSLLYVQAKKHTGEIWYFVINKNTFTLVDSFSTGIMANSQSTYPVGAVSNGYLYFLGTNKLAPEPTVAPSTTPGTRYLYAYYPAPTLTPGSNNNFIQGAAISNDQMFTDFAVDSQRDLYFGDSLNFYNCSNINSAVFWAPYSLEGVKNNVAIGNDGRIYVSYVGNEDYFSAAATPGWGSNGDEVLSFGNSIAAPTPGPTEPSVIGSGWISLDGSYVDISWPPGDAFIVGYNIYMSGSPYELVNTAGPVTGTSYEITGLTSGKEYSFIITSVDQYDRESDPSQPIFITFGTPTVTYTTTQTPTYTPTLTVTSTATPSITQTITETLTSTSSNTPTMTSTVTMTLTLTSIPTMAVLLQYESGDNGNTTTSPHPIFKLQNNDSRQFDLSKIEIRYWYKYEGTGQSETATADYSGILPAGTNIVNYTHLNIVSGTFGANQDRYLSTTFDTGAGSLVSTNYVEVNTRFNKSDWSLYDQTNDWSFLNTANYVSWNQVTVYYNGVLIWGIEPVNYTSTPTYTTSNTITTTPTYTQSGTFTITATSTPSVTETGTGTNTPSPTFTSTFTATYTDTATLTGSPTLTQTFTKTNTPTGTYTNTQTATYTSTISATVSNTYTPTTTNTPYYSPTQTMTAVPLPANVTLQYESGDNNPNSNSPHPQFNLINKGSSGLALSRVEIRYYYSFEGTNQTEQTTCDYAGILPSGTNVTSNTHPAIISGNFGNSQDRYLSITFDSGAGTVNANGSVEVQSRFNKSDWSAYNQVNDYSYGDYTSFTNWNYVTVYVNGTLVWGTTPGVNASALNKGGQVLKTGDIEELCDNSVYNYPNPFSGTTTIRFSVLNSENISIKIYDINGDLVWHENVPDYVVKRGVNTVAWIGKNDNGTQVANGIYICVVSSDTKMVKKLIALVR